MSAKTELGINFKGIDKTAGTIRNIAKGIAGLFVIRQGFEVGKEMISNLLDIEKGAKKAGLGVEEFQRLTSAMEQMDIGADSVALTMMNLQKNLASTSKVKMEAFSDLGLDVAALKNQKPEEIFMKVGAAISKLPSEGDRAAATMQLMGKGSKEMLQLFRKGPETFVEGMKSLKDALPTFSEAAVNAADDISDGFGAVKQTLMVDIANAFMGVGENGKDAFEGIGEAIIASYYKLKLFFSNVITYSGWLKDSVAAIFSEDMMPGFDELSARFQKNIEKNMEDADAAVKRFTKSQAAQNSFKGPMDVISEGAEKAKIKLNEVKQALSQFGTMALSGSYAGIQSQYAGAMPSAGGQQGKSPLTGSGGTALLQQLIDEMRKVTKNTEKTATNTAEIEGDF